MLTFKNDEFQGQLKNKFPGANEQIESIDFQPFSELEESVKNDVKFLKEHPLVEKDSSITGWVYEVETGKVSLCTRFS